MKHIAIAALALSCLTLGFSGCGADQKGAKGAQSPNMVREVEDTVTGMAGGAAFKAGQKGKQKLKAINQQHNDQMNKMLEE